MIELHPQIIGNGERKEFAVLPYNEFLAMQELLADAEDLLQLRRAKEEEAGAPVISLSDVKKRFGLD